MAERMRNNGALLETDGLRADGIGPFDLAVHPGERIFLSGPSGSGKTRLMRMLADLDPHDGDIWLEGRPLRSWPATEWRRHVGLLPAEVRWWRETVGAHFPEQPVHPVTDLGLAAEALTWPVTRLSSGEKQRLGLLRLLANRPRVLLLDEPTANLDPDSTHRVEALVTRYVADSGGALLWVSHDLEQAERMATRRLHIAAGRLSEEAAQ